MTENKIHITPEPNGSQPYGYLTTRQWFAGMAMQGFVSDSDPFSMNWQTCIDYATSAYRMADAMLKAGDE